MVNKISEWLVACEPILPCGKALLTIITIVKDIYDAPDLSRSTVALSTYNRKSLIYTLHQHIHTKTHPSTPISTRTHTQVHASEHNIIYTERKICQSNRGNRLDTFLKRMSF